MSTPYDCGFLYSFTKYVVLYVRKMIISRNSERLLVLTAGMLMDTIRCLVFIVLCCISTFQLKNNFFRNEFKSKNFILTPLDVLVKRLSFKTQLNTEFEGPFYGPKKSLKKYRFITRRNILR